MRLHNKVILVTASTRGIGLAIVKKCAEEGAMVDMATPVYGDLVNASIRR